MSSGVRRPFRILAIATGLAGLTALVGAWSLEPVQWSVQFAFLLVAAIVSENYSVVMGGYSFSVAYPLMMAAIVLCGPSPALLLAGLSSITLMELKRTHWSVTTFNTGQMLLSSALAAAAYAALGGRTLLVDGVAHPIFAGEFLGALAPMLLAALVGSLANILLASVGVSVKADIPVGDVVESVGLLPLGQFAFGIVGFIIAEVMAVNLTAFVLLIFPLLVARQFYEQMSGLKSAYIETIRTLISALEAKDPYTRGHSERVARYSVMIGRGAGLDQRELADLETAALLHDLGKLGLPGAMLRKQGPLDDDEWRAMRSHPEIGAEMVGKIPPLRRLADVVAQHHERLDGSGYPFGLQELARHARILAVADSYDAMTSTRSYRRSLSHETAAAELRRCAGTHYEPELVEILVAAVEQQKPATAEEPAAILVPSEVAS